jgi:predicted Zn-dependent protease
MNKKIIAGALAFMVIALAFFAYQYRPSKRYARHVLKARLFHQEKNFLLAEKEYEAAYKSLGGFSPYISLEVLRMEVEWVLSENKLDKALEYTQAYVQANPKDIEGKRLLAKLKFRAGDVDDFFNLVQEILAVNPADFQTRYFLAQVRMRQNRLDLAEEELASLYQAHPDSVVTILPLAEVLLKRGNLIKSRELLNKVLKDRPKLALARMYLMDSYLLEHKMDSAQWVLDQWSSEDKSLEIPITIRQAHLLSMQNKLEEANALLVPFQKGGTKNIPAMSELALLRVKQGKLDSAYKIYVNIAESKPDEARTPYLLAALILMANQQPAQALEILRRLQVGDKAQSLAFYVSACYKSMDMINRADSVVPKVPVAIQPLLKDFQAQFPVGKTFLSRWAKVNFYQMTEQNYWSLVEAESLYHAYPKNPMTMSVFAQRLAFIKQYAAAAKVQEKIPQPNLRQRATLMEWEINAGHTDKALDLAMAIRKEYPTMPGFSSVIGDLYLRSNQPAKAALAFEAELLVDSNNLICLNNLAWEYGIKQGNLAKAMPFLNKLKAKNASMDPRYFDTIGWVLAKQGQISEAEGYLHKARNLSPGNPSINYHLAWVNLKNGKGSEGKKLLNEALQSAAGFDEKAEAQVLFASVQ